MNSRRQNRERLIYNLKVENRETGDLLGYVVNINPRGMMLLAERKAETPASVPVRVHLPRNVMTEGHFDADGELRWCRRRSENDFYLGVRLVNVPAHAEERVSELIDRFQQDEGETEFLADPYLQNTDPADILPPES